MSKSIVVNKLVLGNELMGYRFDIKENGNRVVSLDLDKDSVKAFLSLVEKDKIIKGYVIKGKVVGDMFVTDNEENVIQVTGKNQAIELLGKHYYGNTDDNIDGLLGSISLTEEEEKGSKLEAERLETKNRIKEFFSKPDSTLIEVRNKDYGYVPTVYNIIQKCGEGVKYRLDINDDDVDKWSARVEFNIYLRSFKDALTFLNNYVRFFKDNEVALHPHFKKFFVNYEERGKYFIVVKPNNIKDFEKSLRIKANNIQYGDRCVGHFTLDVCNMFGGESKNGALKENLDLVNTYLVDETDDNVYVISAVAHTPGYRNEDYGEGFDVDEYDTWGSVFDNILYSGKGLKCVLPDFSSEVFADDVYFVREFKEFKKYLDGLDCSVSYSKYYDSRDHSDYGAIVLKSSFSKLSEALVLQHRLLINTGLLDVDVSLVGLKGNIVKDLYSVDLLKTSKDFIKEVLSPEISQDIVGKVVFYNGNYSKEIVLVDGKYVVDSYIQLESYYDNYYEGDDSDED